MSDTQKTTGKQEAALNLRLGGASPEQIAQTVGFPTAAAARKAIQAALVRRVPATTDVPAEAPHEVRVELARLDGLLLGLWNEARRGDLHAIDRVLKIGERRERLLAVARRRPNDHALRQSFDAAAATSQHVLPTVDGALVEAGRKIADRVDEATASGEGQELTKALYLVPHMVNVLREMLATPASRQAAGVTGRDTGGKLAQLRAIHGKREA